MRKNKNKRKNEQRKKIKRNGGKIEERNGHENSY